jgi:hypothetical protein
MGQFIFYTFEGATISPNDTNIENLQILGIENGFNSKDALEKLLIDNRWIEESGFSKNEIKNYAIVSTSFQNDIQTVIDYLWDDEERHFEESLEDDNHIFRVLQRLKEKTNSI